MPRGVQFLTLLTDLKAELSQASSTALGVDFLPVLRRALRRSYATLHRQWRWPHLHTRFPAVAMAAGQRYYDLPDGLDYDRLDDVVRVYSGGTCPIWRGITLEDYNVYDSESDIRSDPVEKWDIQTISGADQIEVWPIPASNENSLRFSGLTRAKTLVNDADLCDLDSDLVIMFAAASLLPNDKGEKTAKLKEAQAHLSQLKADSAGATPTIRYGMGSANYRITHPVIRVT